MVPTSDNMGLLDHIKSGTKNVLNKTEEELGSMKIESQISDIENDVEKRYTDLGKKVFNNTKEPYDGYEAEVESACKGIQEKLDAIKELQDKLEAHKQTHKDERETNRQAAEAADKKDEEAKAASKPAEEAPADKTE